MCKLFNLTMDCLIYIETINGERRINKYFISKYLRDSPLLTTERQIRFFQQFVTSVDNPNLLNLSYGAVLGSNQQNTTNFPNMRLVCVSIIAVVKLQ